MNKLGQTIAQSRLQMLRYIQPLQARFRQLPRERQQKLCWAGIALGGLLALFGVMKPSWDFANRMKAYATNEKMLHQWMQHMAPQIRTQTSVVTKTANSNDNESLLTLASQSSQTYKLVFQRYEPTADGKLSLWLSNAEFNNLLAWLDQVVTQNHVTVERLAINQTTKPGLVDAQIVLRKQTGDQRGAKLDRP